MRGHRRSGSVRAGRGLELVVRRETREFDERAEERDVVLGLGEGVGLVDVRKRTRDHSCQWEIRVPPPRPSRPRAPEPPVKWVVSVKS